MKNIPLRTCIITKEVLPKKELLRIVIDNLGNVSVDVTGKKNGRGVYLKKDLTLIAKAKEKHLLDKALHVHVDDNIYDEIINVIKGGINGLQ